MRLLLKAVVHRSRYVHSVRREQRQGLHRDFDPAGHWGKDFRNSCDRWCNIGIYLRDQTPEEGPLWVVPGSNRMPRDIGRAGADFNELYGHRRGACAAVRVTRSSSTV